jgi:hypothetical protein
MPIFDQGYQHWKGPLAGHAWRWFAIARHGVRVQLKGWIVRILLLLALLPALALIAAVALWGLVEQKSEGVVGLVASLLPPDMLVDPRAYRTAAWTVAYSTFFKVEMFFIMLLIVVAGPSLISRDLRFNALPLYFARPLTRLDYFIGKLGIIAALVAAVSVGPAVFAYLVGICFSFDLSVVKDTYSVLLGSIGYGLLIALSAGTFMLALSSLSRRSLYVGIGWFGIWWISAAVAGILVQIQAESRRHEIREHDLAAWIQENPPPPGTQMHSFIPAMQYDAENRRTKIVGVEPGHEEEEKRWLEEWMQVNAESWEKARSTRGSTMRDDWRPLCSYTANLERLGESLLNTDAAWVQIGAAWERARQLVPVHMFGSRKGLRAPRVEPLNERRFADEYVPQYPWTWSAGVLAGLLGLSVWTMTFRVKSLDRLK